MLFLYMFRDLFGCYKEFMNTEFINHSFIQKYLVSTNICRHYSRHWRYSNDPGPYSQRERQTISEQIYNTLGGERFREEKQSRKNWEFGLDWE